MCENVFCVSVCVCVCVCVCVHPCVTIVSRTCMHQSVFMHVRMHVWDFRLRHAFQICKYCPIHASICVYACAHVCMGFSSHTCMYVCMYEGMRACVSNLQSVVPYMHASIDVCMYVCMYEREAGHTFWNLSHTCMH
jgi:hypothetical protein